jgi:hypothetical protein
MTKIAAWLAVSATTILMSSFLLTAQVPSQERLESVNMMGVWAQIYTESGGVNFPTIDVERELSKRSAGGVVKEFKVHYWKFTKDAIEDGRETKESPIVKHKYERDVGGKVGTIDLILVRPNANKNEEERKLGIYYPIDDFMMICWNPPGESRPEIFMTQAKSKTTMGIITATQ